MKEKFNQIVFSTLFGIVLALVFFLYNKQTIEFSKEFLEQMFTLFLPLIMVDAAFKINAQQITQNLFYILSYGIIGTLLNFVGMFFVLFIIDYFLDKQDL